YLRLSQMTLGMELIPDSVGTCTMKYSPKVDERLARSERVADLHPDQDESTVQGILEIAHRLGEMLCEISGLDAFSFQPGGGAQGGLAAAARPRDGAARRAPCAAARRAAARLAGGPRPAPGRPARRGPAGPGAVAARRRRAGGSCGVVAEGRDVGGVPAGD